jgi:integrase
VPGFDATNNRVHARRDCSAEELARLLEVARDSVSPAKRLTGNDRYFLYLVAFATGFRAEELSHLTPAAFDLDAPQPVVSLPGKFTKNKKPARQPVPLGVAAQLRGYLSGKPADRPVWPGSWWKHAARILRKDLKAAGIPYRIDTPSGPAVLDFHALRHSFMSALAAAGVGPKEMQELARHSDPRLTLGVYTHARPEALGGRGRQAATPRGG